MQAFIGAELLKRAKPAAKPFEIRDTRLKGFLLRVQPSGTLTFYCEYGRGKRYRIGRADAVKPDAARRKAKEILNAAYLGDDPMQDKRNAKAHTLETFVDEVYAPWTEATMRTAAETVRSLKKNFPDLQRKKLHEITPWLVEKWRSARLKANAQPATVNRALDNLRAAMARAVEWGFLAENPLAKVKRTKTDTAAPIRYLAEGEEAALLIALVDREKRIRAERASANAWRAERGYPLHPDLRSCTFADHLRPIVLLSLNTGMRRGELFSLDWQDVDLDRAVLTVRGLHAKSKKTRHLPLNAVALEALTRWREQSQSGLVFPSRTGERLTNVQKSWASVLSAAGITSFRWHDLRHHFASKLVMAGVDLNTVRELLGHSTITMTLRYAHLGPEHKAAAVARLVAQ